MKEEDTISIDRLTAKRIIADLDQVIQALHDDWYSKNHIPILSKAKDDLKAAHDTSVMQEIDGLFKEHDRLMSERDRVLGLRTKLFPDETG